MEKSIVVLDDNPYDLEDICSKLSVVKPNWQIEQQFNCPVKAISYLENARPDLLITDINMPFYDGFQVVSKLVGSGIPVVFTTSYEEHAVRAFEFSASDYLLKPVSIHRLRAALDRVELIQKNHSDLQLSVLQESIQSLNSLQANIQRIIINNQKSIDVININDIIQCEANGPYSKFVLNEGMGAIISSKPVKYYEYLLTGLGFFRIHRSHLVNMRYVRKINKETMEVQLTNKEMLPVAPERLGVLIEDFKKMMELSKF